MVARMHWDYEPVNSPHPSFGHPLPILVQRSRCKGWGEGRGEGERFMESPHDNGIMHWDHEPYNAGVFVAHFVVHFVENCIGNRQSARQRLEKWIAGTNPARFMKRGNIRRHSRR